MANLTPTGAQELSVAEGATAFVIDGILLSLSDVLPGDELCTSGASAPIATVDDDDGHGLGIPWPGSTITSSTSWWIRRVSDLRYRGVHTAEQASRVATHFAQALALGLPYKVLAETNTPPSDPEEEDRYLIGTSPTGAWASNAKNIATWFNGAWVFAAPQIGDTATNFTSSVMKVFDGTSWNAASSLDIINTELLALAGLTSAADKGIHFTGSGTAATHTLTAQGRALIAGADAAAQRATMGAAAKAGDTFSGLVTINLNALPLPAPAVGTVFHIGAADGVFTRFTMDGFQTAPAFSGRFALGTNAAKTGMVSNALMFTFGTQGFTGTDYSATTASFDFLASENWVHGSAYGTRARVQVTPNGSTTRLTVATFEATAVAFAVPVRMPSYTVATVPSASVSGAGAGIYVTNESGGAVLAFSDGTDWRRVTDRAVIS